MSSPLNDVSLNLVETLEDAMALKRWLGERREVLGVDTETGGFSPYHDDLRLVQVGDLHTGWSIPWPLWGGLAQEVLRNYEGEMVAHNASFDWRFLHQRANIDIPWHRYHDTMTLATLDDPTRVRGLKPLSAKLIDRNATAGENALHEGMRANKWTWATVPYEFPAYWAYAALDPVLTCHLFSYFYPRVQASSPEVYSLERGITRVCTKMMLKGMQLDRTWVNVSISKLRKFSEETRAWLSENHDISSPLAARQIAKAMEAAGCYILDEIRTPTGLPKADKATLELIKNSEDAPQAARDIAQYLLAIRHAEKIIGSYLENFLTMADENDVIHPQIHPLQARTGRMCLPESHKLLTQRGVLHISDVCEGDLTIDADGNWTPVRAIYRYKNQDTVQYRHAEIRLESTVDHRWVLSNEESRSQEKRKIRIVEPISDARRRVHLTPSDVRFDFTSHDVPLDGTQSVQFAALIGWLVSDGRVHDSGPGQGLKARVYQTEKKFYKEMMRCIPEDAFMFDRITNGADHHEIGIRARWLHPRLRTAGLSADPLLRESWTLVPWVLSLNLRELHAFFSAVWLADGTTAYPQNKQISCGSAPLRVALQYAGYMLGLTSRVVEMHRSNWSSKTPLAVKFRTKKVSTRYFHRMPGRADVWCVSTDSGTLTAWDEGPYLTGNSITDPALQTLHRDDKIVRGSFIPREGNVFISCDADQIEARLSAHLSADTGMIQAFKDADSGGLDFFSGIASEIFGEPIAKSDHRRQLTKNTVYGSLYGAGAEKMAQTAGVPVSVMAPVKDAFNARFPGLSQLMGAITREARDQMARGERPHTRTALGRYLPGEDEKPYALTNYKIQSTAVDILKQGILNLDAVGFGDYMLLPIHDEVLLEIPAGEAEEAKRLVEETLTDRENYLVPITWSADIIEERWQK